MRRRFLWTQAIADTIALAIGIVPASLIDFSTPLPWTAEPRVVPLIVMMFVALVVAEISSARMWAGNAPRPSYGRALAIVITTVGWSSLFLTLT